MASHEGFLVYSESHDGECVIRCNHLDAEVYAKWENVSQGVKEIFRNNLHVELWDRHTHILSYKHDFDDIDEKRYVRDVDFEYSPPFISHQGILEV